MLQADPRIAAEQRSGIVGELHVAIDLVRRQRRSPRPQPERLDRRARFGLAAEVALTAGRGRNEGGPARLIIAVEPGVRALFRTRAGSFGAAVVWYQPFAVDRRWIGALVPSAVWRVLEF